MQKDCPAYADIHTVLPMRVKSSLNPGLFISTITAEQRVHAGIKGDAYMGQRYSATGSTECKQFLKLLLERLLYRLDQENER